MATIVKVLPDGPLRVEGECQMQDGQGNPIPTTGDAIFLCRCGSSAKKPFCDGAHKRVGFKS
jgi:3-phenylpropionate/trans-cinnamate dioxygenase ferredoxin subunit